MATYLIVIERAEDGGYGAYAPDLPGVGVLGDTLGEIHQLAREALTLHIEGVREYGEPVPRPTAVAAAMVEVTEA